MGSKELNPTLEDPHSMLNLQISFHKKSKNKLIVNKKCYTFALKWPRKKFLAKNDPDKNFDSKGNLVLLTRKRVTLLTNLTQNDPNINIGSTFCSVYGLYQNRKDINFDSKWQWWILWLKSLEYWLKLTSKFIINYYHFELLVAEN